MDASDMPQRRTNGRIAVDDAPVGSVGGGSPSTLSTGEGGTATPPPGPLAPGQRWSLARKRAVVLRLIAGEPVELVSREIGVPVFKLERWRQKAEVAIEGALKQRETGAGGAELAAALQRVGELTMENELLRAKMGQMPGPLARRRWR
jgi:transposase